MIDEWRNGALQVFGSGTRGTSTLKILWIVGSLDISGGTNVILHWNRGLADAGHQSSIMTVMDRGPVKQDWHEHLESARIITREEAVKEFFDVVIVTWWPTVAALEGLNYSHAVYLVQSLENRFSSQDQAASELALATYGVGLPSISIATWLSTYLQSKTGNISTLVRYGIDKTLFTKRANAPKSESSKLKVLIEGSVDTSMKGIPESLAACADLNGVHTTLLTPSHLERAPGIDRIVSRVSMAEAAEIYGSCDVLVKTSHVEGLYGPPLEMMHAGGTVITYPVTGSEDFIIHGYNALVVQEGNIQAIRQQLERLRDEHGLLNRLKEGAGETANSWPSWTLSRLNFNNAVNSIYAVTAPTSPEQRERLAEFARNYEKLMGKR